MKCANCSKKYLKDLFDDGQEMVYICEVDNHYIGYPDELDIECETEGVSEDGENNE